MKVQCNATCNVCGQEFSNHGSLIFHMIREHSKRMMRFVRQVAL